MYRLAGLGTDITYNAVVAERSEIFEVHRVQPS